MLHLSTNDILSLKLGIHLAKPSMSLVEQIIIDKDHPLFDACTEVCHKSKNLYNSALYASRQQYFKNQTFLFYESLAKQFAAEKQVDYVVLPAKVAQQTLKLLSQNLKSFFALQKSVKLDANKKKQHKIPKYYPTGDKGICVVTYTNQAIYRATFAKTGLIHLSGTDIKFHSDKISEFKQIDQVRIIPKSNEITKNRRFTIEVVYTASCDLKADNERLTHLVWHTDKDSNNINNYKINRDGSLALGKDKHESLTGMLGNVFGIDINLNNLAIVGNEQEWLFNLRRMKSYNRHYNKQMAEVQALIDKKTHTVNKIKAQLSKLEPKNQQDRINFLSIKLERFTTEIQHLKDKRYAITVKRNQKIQAFNHNTSRQLINQLIELDCDTLIIGKSISSKQGINHGSVNNQNFVQMPFGDLINKLIYKANLAGIHVLVTEESYSSKCSFMDQETLFSFPKKDKPKDYIYQGKRIQRGTFKTHSGRLVHADINAAYNIIRKVSGADIYHKIDTCSVMGSSPKSHAVRLQ